MLQQQEEKCFRCLQCGRVLRVYVNLVRPPHCSRCNKEMATAEHNAVAGQMSLFSDKPGRGKRARRSAAPK